MIVDTDTTFDSTQITTDVCIVGSGAAGITLAREFDGTDIKVCVLESGGMNYEDDIQSLNEGDNVGLDYFPLEVTRMRYLGGTTNHWGGMSAPFQLIDFEPRPWVSQSGWPINLSTLEPFYKRAHEICEIANPNYSPEFLEKMLATKRLPLDPSNFFTTIRHYSPPTKFGQKYQSLLKKSDNVTVMLHSNVMNFSADASGSSITRVQCKTRSFRAFEVRARFFILAAGGIENPRLLLVSNDVHTKGLGNQHDLVGRYFMENPHKYVGVLAPESPDIDATAYHGNTWRRKAGVRASFFVQPSEELQRSENLLNGKFSLNPIYVDQKEDLLEEYSSVIEKIGRYIYSKDVIDPDTFRTYFEKSKHIDHFEVSCSWEQSPNRNSRVLLSSKKDSFGQNMVQLDWQIHNSDKVALQRTCELFAQEIGRAGIGRLKLNLHIKDWMAGFHHMGTTKMSADEKQGVVDTDCRLYGMSNLYVAGSSVFPTSGATNPTLTIVALAVRLANHIKKKLT